MNCFLPLRRPVRLPLLLLLLLLLLGRPPGVVRAQAGPADGLVRRLPAGGLLLDRGWKYRLGDDPAWARPDFDESGWDTLTPSRPRSQLPPRLQTGISWLRLRLRVGDSLRRQALVLQAGGLGAWEIYFNGRLMQRAGRLSADPRRVQPANRWGPQELVDLPALGPGEQVVALRFAPWQPPLLQAIEELPLLRLSLLAGWQARRQEPERAPVRGIFYVVAGIFALLTLLHLAFFRYNPARRANLYFAFYTLSLALGSLCLYYNETLALPTLSAHLGLGALAFALLLLSSLWSVRALYALFGFRPGWLYAGLWVGFGALLVFCTLHIFGIGVFAYLASVVLAAAEQLRLTGRALLRRQRGAWIIGVGFACELVAVLGQVGFTLLGIPLPLLIANLTFCLTCLPPALGISLFLAREFALDAQLLQVKLAEVERLSARTLAQEQEKQALLAQQNETLERQVQQRTAELQHSLTTLRATQAQLIQREKMASLGELTAGIAHEIQNPLNFVTNFSEVTVELATELEEEQQRPARDPALEGELLGSIRQNLGKIHLHGQRAAGIVRGMLEHSRASPGERTPTDVNALCDEYLRLAYHGLRAKDREFSAELRTDLAPDLPALRAVGADLGRVLLNLFTNALLAVQQRQQLGGPPGYQPTVGVSTRRAGPQVEIRVQDNGGGIPAAVQTKIFQPFFTTRPAGQGTGLGLSLSYDIITNGHGGTLTARSQEGQGAEFIICLPI